ncbi:MAG TPA: ABC transporter ATP-binding protein [Gemmatimonadales bacterium]|nr:ABC transporter ATP-binding protein [Gemmatimonadales bacterium]
MGADRFLVLEHLTRRFGAVTAVDDVSISLAAGEILALLGPSGSGKTTILRLLAGFEAPDTGRVIVGGDDVTGLAPVARRFGMVFQHYALFPHLDVAGNVGFGLEGRGMSEPQKRARIEESLALVDLAGYADRRIGQLSGGQQQRVALARALAPEPRVLLLDEPLSNLDPALRERTRREIRELIHRVGTTTVFVTHEQDEAFDLGDRVAVLRNGRLEQAGTPEELYGQPANAFVAGFVGRSAAVPVQVTGNTERGVRIALFGAEWDIPQREGGAVKPGPAMLHARPEALWLREPGPGVVSGVVRGRRFTGAGAAYQVELDGGSILEVGAAPGAAQPGDRVGIVPSRRASGGLHLFPMDRR